MAVNVGINLGNPTKVNAQVGPLQVGLQIGSTATPSGGSGAGATQNPSGTTTGGQPVNVQGNGKGYTGGGNGDPQPTKGNEPPWAHGNNTNQPQLHNNQPPGIPNQAIGAPTPGPPPGSTPNENFGMVVGADGNPLPLQTSTLQGQTQTAAAPPTPDAGGAPANTGGGAQGGLGQLVNGGLTNPTTLLQNTGLGIGAQVNTGSGQGVSLNSGINLNLGISLPTNVGAQVNLGPAQVQLSIGDPQPGRGNEPPWAHHNRASVNLDTGIQANLGGGSVNGQLRADVTLSQPSSAYPSSQTPNVSVTLEASAGTSYLTGQSAGNDLPPMTRQILDQVSQSVGQGAVQDFVSRGGQAANHLVGQIVRQANQSFAQAATQPFAQAPVAQHLANELASAVQIVRHFTRLEQTGGSIVQGARDAALNMMSRCFCEGSYAPWTSRLSAQELLRDLRSGALLYPVDLNNPFPLTGNLRISREMAELLRVLEAIAMNFAPSKNGALPYNINLLMQWLGIDEELARLLFLGLPNLPGRVARLEILNLVMALEGLLANRQGFPLLTVDGQPVRLNHLLWFNPLGGLLNPSLLGLNPLEHVTPSSSTLVVYGFDAVFSLIGFDGRSLKMPHYAAIQAEVNGSKSEGMFGHPPMSEGWMRAIIERLKDAVSVEQNLLGEHLEEALTDGRMHLVLMRGEAENGVAVPDSYDFSLADAAPSRRFPAKPQLAFA
jgi:hypothetical protein